MAIQTPIKVEAKACKFSENVTCKREGLCPGCVVWDYVNSQVETILDICPVCGADREVWREVFGEEHNCTERY